jgi:DNA-binding NtrC family response regulator
LFAAAIPFFSSLKDEVLIRLSICDFLRDEGFTVIEAGNARDALAVLNVRRDITLVLTDLNMSGAMEGVRLIREIRRSYPAIKVITASAYQVTEPVEATITKPYSLDRLLAIIKSLLDL